VFVIKIAKEVGTVPPGIHAEVIDDAMIGFRVAISLIGPVGGE
jgi:hypothetical protein